MAQTTVYLASPLGFSPENRDYRDRVKEKLKEQGCDIFDPWDQPQFVDDIRRAGGIADYTARVGAFREIAAAIGRSNEEGIRQADVVFAVLDGVEVDSGTASELGFGSALGKKCYGLRTDWRDSGDFNGIAVNLQLLHFIERSGGVLFRSIDGIEIGQGPLTGGAVPRPSKR